MKSSLLTWLCRALWLFVPLLLGDVFTTRLTGATGSARMIWQVFLWAVWLVGVVASFVQLPRSLTVMRMIMPAALVLGGAFWLTAPDGQRAGILGVSGLILALVVAVLVMSADVGRDFIDGASYGDETRLGLAVPVFLLIGPIQMLWLLGTAPVAVSVALLASARWGLGATVGAIAVVLSSYSYRSLNRLSERCLVLVPAGITLVDPLSLAEPTLFRRDDVVRLGPAVVGADADGSVADLTVGAPGLVVSMDFSRELSIVPVPERGQIAEPVEIRSVLVSPTRPGVLLEMAEARRIAVSRS